MTCRKCEDHPKTGEVMCLWGITHLQNKHPFFGGIECIDFLQSWIKLLNRTFIILAKLTPIDHVIDILFKLYLKLQTLLQLAKPCVVSVSSGHQRTADAVAAKPTPVKSIKTFFLIWNNFCTDQTRSLRTNPVAGWSALTRFACWKTTSVHRAACVCKCVVIINLS